MTSSIIIRYTLMSMLVAGKIGTIGTCEKKSALPTKPAKYDSPSRVLTEKDNFLPDFGWQYIKNRVNPSRPDRTARIDTIHTLPSVISVA